MTTKIATTAVCFGDQPRALRFWTAQIGFTVHGRESMGRAGDWLEVGPREAGPCLVLDPRALMQDWPERKTPIVFECAEIGRTNAELSARGVRFTRPATDMPRYRFAQFEDMDGSWLWLRQSRRR